MRIHVILRTSAPSKPLRFGTFILLFFFSSRRRHTRSLCDWSSDVCFPISSHHTVRSGEQQGFFQVALGLMRLQDHGRKPAGGCSGKNTARREAGSQVKRRRTWENGTVPIVPAFGICPSGLLMHACMTNRAGRALRLAAPLLPFQSMNHFHPYIIFFQAL